MIGGDAAGPARLPGTAGGIHPSPLLGDPRADPACAGFFGVPAAWRAADPPESLGARTVRLGGKRSTTRIDKRMRAPDLACPR